MGKGVDKGMEGMEKNMGVDLGKGMEKMGVDLGRGVEKGVDLVKGAEKGVDAEMGKGKGLQMGSFNIGGGSSSSRRSTPAPPRPRLPPPPPPPSRSHAGGDAEREPRTHRPRGGQNREWWAVYHQVIRSGLPDAAARAAANALHDRK